MYIEFDNAQVISDLNKSHFQTVGTKARLKWVEQYNKGKKGKTIYNFPDETDGSQREESRLKKKN